MSRFVWDPAKARSNLAKHGIGFDDASLVFADPLHLLRFDRMEGVEERWHILGLAGGVVVLLVAHTYPEEGVARIVSARKATRLERRAYEDGDF